MNEYFIFNKISVWIYFDEIMKHSEFELVLFIEKEFLKDEKINKNANNKSIRDGFSCDKTARKEKEDVLDSLGFRSPEIRVQKPISQVQVRRGLYHQERPVAAELTN